VICGSSTVLFVPTSVKRFFGYTVKVHSIVHDNETYLSTTAAAEKFDFARDYIGELCREKRARCVKVGRSWYIREADLAERKGREETIAEALDRAETHETPEAYRDESMLIDGKRYISSGRAAREHGYTQDYIGQLIRKGGIPAKKIGRTWYVDPDSLGKHKQVAAKNAAKMRWQKMVESLSARYEADESPLLPPLQVKTADPGVLLTFLEVEEAMKREHSEKTNQYTFEGDSEGTAVRIRREDSERAYVAPQKSPERALRSHQRASSAGRAIGYFAISTTAIAVAVVSLTITQNLRYERTSEYQSSASELSFEVPSLTYFSGVFERIHASVTQSLSE